MNKKPSREEIERALQKSSDDFRNLNTVTDAVFRKFKSLCPLYRIAIIPHGDNVFQVLVFFKRDADIEVCRADGMVKMIEESVYDELKRVGRGERPDISAQFEIDSDENVDRNYQSNYFFRFH